MISQPAAYVDAANTWRGEGGVPEEFSRFTKARRHAKAAAATAAAAAVRRDEDAVPIMDSRTRWKRTGSEHTPRQDEQRRCAAATPPHGRLSLFLCARWCLKQQGRLGGLRFNVQFCAWMGPQARCIRVPHPNRDVYDVAKGCTPTNLLQAYHLDAYGGHCQLIEHGQMYSLCFHA